VRQYRAHLFRPYRSSPISFICNFNFSRKDRRAIVARQHRFPPSGPIRRPLNRLWQPFDAKDGLAIKPDVERGRPVIIADRPQKRDAKFVVTDFRQAIASAIAIDAAALAAPTNEAERAGLRLACARFVRPLSSVAIVSGQDLPQ
jgi:hypothetical protein